ncbi:unnamed protein product [Macrosiphum euphorbiae]|uniref:Uncharacterized protein n=1 Tax=Macrosiphum euphorbiae TaxID=13131 RepID=A0AAV0WL08_9HEMI|nr:unnamed protein product [Macrosiphum euphorbiae]
MSKIGIHFDQKHSAVQSKHGNIKPQNICISINVTNIVPLVLMTSWPNFLNSHRKFGDFLINRLTSGPKCWFLSRLADYLAISVDFLADYLTSRPTCWISRLNLMSS